MFNRDGYSSILPLGKVVFVVCNLGTHSINVVKCVILVRKHGSKPEFQWLSIDCIGVLNVEGVDAWWNYIPGPDSNMPNMILILCCKLLHNK